MVALVIPYWQHFTYSRILQEKKLGNPICLFNKTFSYKKVEILNKIKKIL